MIIRYILRNWVWIVAGMIFTKEAVRNAYVARGYIAYGGEWLVLPLMLMAVGLIRNICNTVRYLSGTEEDLKKE